MSATDRYTQEGLFAGPEPAGPPAERLAELAVQARDCRACPLWEIGRQTVFGRGPAPARLMVVGEAPGRQEDERGAPFVGLAGQLLDRAFAQAGLARDELYLTNVVKHRPWLDEHGRQKNRPPRQGEINACRPWLHRELDLVRPELIVCVGATAAREILGKAFRLTAQRGQWLEGPGGATALATLHPAYVLIQPAESRDRLEATLFGDFARVGERYRALEC